MNVERMLKALSVILTNKYGVRVICKEGKCISA